MPTLSSGRYIVQLVVVFTPSLLSVVGATEIDETSDADSRSCLIRSPQYGSAWGAHAKLLKIWRREWDSILALNPKPLSTDLKRLAQST